MKFFIALILLLQAHWANADPSVLVASANGSIIAQNAQTVRPIASITKLMTALVALNSGIGLDNKTALINKWSTVLPKKQYTRRELLTAMLIRSDNSAAESLAHDYPGGRSAFIDEMNRTAVRLGMKDTQFEDASGLSKNNVSTAEDLQKLLKETYSIQLVRDISTSVQGSVRLENKKTFREIVFPNTNVNVLNEFKQVQVSKTGLTTPAGWCLGMVVMESDQPLYIVVLGYKTKQQRLDKIKEIMYNHIIGKLS